MKKSALIALVALVTLFFVYVAQAKKAAEDEAELWSEALDPAY